MMGQMDLAKDGKGNGQQECRYPSNQIFRTLQRFFLSKNIAMRRFMKNGKIQIKQDRIEKNTHPQRELMGHSSSNNSSKANCDKNKQAHGWPCGCVSGILSGVSLNHVQFSIIQMRMSIVN